MLVGKGLGKEGSSSNISSYKGCSVLESEENNFALGIIQDGKKL